MTAQRDIYLYRCINIAGSWRVNSVIVLKDANDAKVYIFNFDTNQQTQDFYDLLCKKVDKVGVSYTESHSVYH